jgi:anthranilate synthase component I
MGENMATMQADGGEKLYGMPLRGLYYPSREEFRDLAARYNLVTVVREVEADLETPVSAYLKLARGDHSFLLESADQGTSWGRYSILGCEPSTAYSYSGGSAECLAGGNILHLACSHPLEHIFETMRAFRPAPAPVLLPFSGGAVGYFGYDLLPYMEKVSFASPQVLDLPDMLFMLTRRTVVFDHLLSRLYLMINVAVPARYTPGDADGLYDRALEELEEMASRLRGKLPAAAPEVLFFSPDLDLSGVESNKTPEEFGKMVERAVDYIHAGDAFQIVVSQRFHFDLSCDPFSVYRALRMENPSPYMFYIKFADIHLVGSSPEPMIRRRGNTAVIRPIAGTRRRGETPEQDRELERELLADEKERAEHIMLVDLARNDLGRVCRPGSVQVHGMMEVERYSQVMHIVSEVRGELAAGRDNSDLLRASFPAGTVTGAPKVRACEIVDELEGERRGVYAGAVGYLGYAGDMDTCIAIRTLVVKGRDAWLQAGAGIVADSQPDFEYQESVNKARAVLRAVKRAEAMQGVR